MPNSVVCIVPNSVVCILPNSVVCIVPNSVVCIVPNSVVCIVQVIFNSSHHVCIVSCSKLKGYRVREFCTSKYSLIVHVPSSLTS